MSIADIFRGRLAAVTAEKHPQLSVQAYELGSKTNRTDAFRTRLAAKMTEAGRNFTSPDASDDYGYVVKVDGDYKATGVVVAWDNFRELEDFAADFFPNDSWGPGKLGTSSPAQDGIVKPEWLEGVKYLILFDADDHEEQVDIESVKGLADTANHAEALISWLNDHDLVPSGRTLRYREINR